MKYSIEVNNNTVTEQLEYKGRTYWKEWDVDCNRICTRGKQFCDQLEDAGVTDERILDGIYETLDSSGLAFMLSNVFRQKED